SLVERSPRRQVARLKSPLLEALIRQFKLNRLDSNAGSPGIKFNSASSGFVISLSLRSFRASQKAFTVEQNPGNSMLCCFRLARIVSTDAVIQILTRTT